MKEDMNDLREFLVTAKKNTYAAGKGAITSSRQGSKDLAFRDNNFYYHDSYFGDKYFSGEEIVYFKDLPVWSMNYYGKMLIDNIPEGFDTTFHNALLKVSEERPYRGPELYTNNNYRYQCLVEGDLYYFSGVEKMFYESEEVYRLYFHGGSIK